MDFWKAKPYRISKIIVGVSPIILIVISKYYESNDTIISYLILVGIKAMTAAWFILIGYYGQKLFAKINHHDVLCIVIGIAFSGINIGVCGFNPEIDLNHFDLGKIPILFFLTGVIGAWGILLITRTLCVIFKNNVIINFLSFYGENSLVVMLTHLPFPMVALCMKLISKLVHVNYIIQCVLVFCMVLLIEFVVIQIINEYLPELIGKKSDKSLFTSLKFRQKRNVKNSK